MSEQNKSFKILSLDGGGIRGIFSARVLELIEKKLNINIHNTFDLIVGTSTGSIVAAAVATKHDLPKLVTSYELHAPRIFEQKTFPSSVFRWKGIYRSKYDSKTLESFLYDEFGEIKLGDIEKPLIINATNASTGKVHVFKSRYQQNQRNRSQYIRDDDVPLYKAILASCSAPVYFDPARIGDGLICDGGLWANNPALVGYTDAINNFKQSHESIKIVSIGTGKPAKFYSPASKWGLLTGWHGRKIIDFAMLCQSQYAENCLKLIMPNNIFRINPEIDDWGLDNRKSIPILKELASSEVINSGERIKRFLG